MRCSVLPTVAPWAMFNSSIMDCNTDPADIEIVEIINPYTSVASGSMTGSPKGAKLCKNYPEPFNAKTSIPIELDRPAHVRLEIYNTQGRRVERLYDESLGTGRHIFTWTGTQNQKQHLPSGSYIIRMTVDGRTHSRKLTLLK